MKIIFCHHALRKKSNPPTQQDGLMPLGIQDAELTAKLMLEANKKSLSAHSVLESDEGKISMLLITNSFSSPFLFSIIQI